ncbi:MAG: hypothetical protein J6B49_04650 [Phascolarctobacterium sp.]|nr:hypothetical protein [Phascolarctobacterium sp.]
MKKISFICGILLALASSVYAYDNDYTHKISTETATKICGEKFSTTYFDEQYEKLALLKRCELSLKTVPLPIWNLDKYEEAGVNLPYFELGINKLDDVKSFLSVDKIGKHKVITVSHLYKQNKKLYALNTSLLSEADKLYALTTYEVDDKVFASKDDDNKEEIPAIIKRMQEKEEAKIVNVTPAEIDVEVRDKIWQEHKRYVKKFKASKFKEVATKEDKK